MSTSYARYDKYIEGYLRGFLHSTDRVLDVGPGTGKYSLLVNGRALVDCLEIHAPYVEQYNLRSLYRNVWVGDVRCLIDATILTPVGFSKSPWEYRLMILGDVLEHLTAPEACHLITFLQDVNAQAIVAVPYRFPQGGTRANKHEAHLQDDLTPEVMNTRYPELTEWKIDNTYGLYLLE